MPSAPPQNFHDLVASMKRATAVLRDAGIEHLLGGGLAIWARGGPPTDHDVDLYLRPGDAKRALEALVQYGMRPEKPTEDWLYKVRDQDGSLIDLIFRPAGGEIDNSYFGRANEIEVSAQKTLVASIDDVLVSKLLAITEQEPDYRAILEVSRALREQVNWAAVRARTSVSPFAQAFFTLAEGLGIVDVEPALATSST